MHFPVAVLISHNIQSNMHTKHLIKNVISICFCLLFCFFFWSQHSRLIAEHFYSNCRLLSGERLRLPAARYVTTGDNKVLLMRETRRQRDKDSDIVVGMTKANSFNGVKSRHKQPHWRLLARQLGFWTMRLSGCDAA